MKLEQWESFLTFREEFRDKCQFWYDKYARILLPLQEEIAKKDKVPFYPVENPVVYNTALDEITESSDIKLILIGDNPGKNEQLNINKKYLVGQSGKIANGFFNRNPELSINFRENVIILNKTPVHTAKTKELAFLCSSSQKLADLIKESQIWMAEKTVQLHIDLGCQMWLVGYGEVKDKGLFQEYKKAFLESYHQNEKGEKAYKKFFVYQHFSMNRFLIDLKEFQERRGTYSDLEQNSNSPASLQSQLEELGIIHRKQIFGE